MQNATHLTITNPLVLYRALVATNRIKADPAQLRLALHLQKLYDRLRDYEPTIAYRQRLQQLGRAIGPRDEDATPSRAPTTSGLWSTLLQEKEKRNSLALTRVLNDHEEALKLDSPKGLMVHGEVGTGKSMLIDLFAECLPTQKKRRYHFNTFMLETFSRLEQLRASRNLRSRIPLALADQNDHSMLWLARDLIESSPILFLDEFQLPDRASAKIMTNLMSGFFGLGGVLIATSNRMPDELAKAAGIEFVQPATKKGPFSWSFGRNISSSPGSALPGTSGEFAQFLELLKARCDVWEMEGRSDYRRSEEADRKARMDNPATSEVAQASFVPSGATETAPEETTERVDVEKGLPMKYFIHSTGHASELPPELATEILKSMPNQHSLADIPWQPAAFKIYGRTVLAHRTFDGTAFYTFNELCVTNLGPADYITFASTFHTFIITHVPVLTALLKNEARRFITLLDALYEAKCKLLISAEAAPDDLFFPDLRPSANTQPGQPEGSDAVYAETFSEMHQDLTAPFRPNVSSYTSSLEGDEPDRTHARLAGLFLADDALEDDPPNKIKRMMGRTDSDFMEDEKLQVKRTPNFANTGIFTGEDEKFAYKRATSRLWEMCSKKWWERNEEGWWRPLPADSRGWEGDRASRSSTLKTPAVVAEIARLEAAEGAGGARDVNDKEDEVMFRYGMSPFRRRSAEPPPKFGWTHFWGTMKWGKKAGAWGQGVEGLKDRKKGKE